MTNKSVVSVGMAEIAVSKAPVQFCALGLGSCIGLISVCRRTHVAGMVHIMLPEAFAGRPVDKVGKFADTGIPELLRLMKEKGAAEPSDYTFAYAGGAQVFAFGTSGNLEIGARNSVAVAEHLSRLRAKVVAKDVGGNLGRTLTYDMASGQVTVKCPQTGVKPLCNLPSPADNLFRRSA